jgi:Flp pilus assembly protein TadB
MGVFSRAISLREIERARRVLGVAEKSSDKTLVSAPRVSYEGTASRLGAAFEKLLLHASPSASELRGLQLIFVVLVGISFAALVLLRTPLGFVGICLGILVPFLWLKRRVFQRAEAFERDYPAMLLSLSSSIRTGLDPLVALQRTTELFPATSEVGKELRGLCQNIEKGLTEEQAVRSFGRSIQHPDIRLFQTAFLLARREGSSLSACLQRLVKVTRNRQSFRRKMRGAVAMQKLSAIGIAACAFAIVCIQAVTNFEAIRLSLQHPVGSKMLAGGGALMVLGLGWMLRMSKARL